MLISLVIMAIKISHNTHIKDCNVGSVLKVTQNFHGEKNCKY